MDMSLLSLITINMSMKKKLYFVRPIIPFMRFVSLNNEVVTDENVVILKKFAEEKNVVLSFLVELSKFAVTLGMGNAVVKGYVVILV